MSYNIETSREPDGRWVARVPAVPGLAAFGGTQEESLAVAKDVAAILMDSENQPGAIILGFYPGRIPDHARIAIPPLRSHISITGGGRELTIPATPLAA